jgi:hypothetical protein
MKIEEKNELFSSFFVQQSQGDNCATTEEQESKWNHSGLTTTKVHKQRDSLLLDTLTIR